MLIGLLGSEEFCYNSLNYFLLCIKETLQRHGIQTEWISEIDEQLFETRWDALIGINNEWPSVQIDEDGFVLDYLECPVFEILVDAPYYHHKILKNHMSNLHVIVLDEGHVEYCKKFYSPLQSVSMACLLGPIAKQKDYSDRTIDVLFTGSLGDIGSYRQKVKDDYAGKWQEHFFEKIIELGMKMPDMTTENVVKMLLEANHIECTDGEFCQMMNYFGTYAEGCLRSYYRQKLITTLVNSGIRVCVVGEGWDRLYTQCPPNLDIMQSVDFAKVAELTVDAKIVLNVMPWFKDGMHDRILSAMMNESVCVTDGSTYINTHFVDGEELIIYDLKEIEKLPDRIKFILENEDYARSVAKKGKETVLKNYSWDKIVEETILPFATFL